MHFLSFSIYIGLEYVYSNILNLNAFGDFYTFSKFKNIDFLMLKAKLHNVEKDEYYKTDYFNSLNFQNLSRMMFLISRILVI